MEITEMYENVTSDKSNLVTKTSTTICNCPDCKKTSIKLECETNVAFTRKKKNADASLLDKDIEALKSFDTQNISKRMDVSFMPCHECEVRKFLLQYYSTLEGILGHGSLVKSLWGFLNMIIFELGFVLPSVVHLNLYLQKYTIFLLYCRLIR